VEKERLDFLRNSQPLLRTEKYRNLQEQLGQDDSNPAAIGQTVILLTSFYGGDRAMQQLFQNLIYLVTHFGKPDLFITFTANSNWEKVITALFKGQTVTNKSDIIARVFRAKLKDLIN
jgi:hypothetical protein